MKYLLILICAWAMPAVAQVQYQPETGSVVIPVEDAYKLELLARKGVMCEELIDSTNGLLSELEGQKIVDYRTILQLRGTLLETRQLTQDLQLQLQESEKKKANLQRHLDIARADADYYRRKGIENVFKWSLGSAAVAVIGTLILVSQAK